MSHDLPANLDAEKALLGALIIQPDLIPEVAAVIVPGAFYRADHERLFNLLSDMYRQRLPIDLVTVPEYMCRDHNQDRYGGVSYVVGLPDCIPSTTAWRHYAEIIDRSYRARELILSLGECLEDVRSLASEPDVVIDRVARLAGEAKIARRRDDSRMFGDAIRDRIDYLDRRASGEVPPERRVTSGMWNVDRKVYLRPGNLVILAARPGVGKSALLLNIALNAAMDGELCLLFSMEMSEDELVDRALAILTGIPHDHIQDPAMLSPEEWDRLVEARDEFEKLPIICDYRTRLSPEEIWSRCLQVQAQHGQIGLVGIDYLGLIPFRVGHRTEETGIHAAKCKQMAVDLSCPVLALHQLSRRVDDRKGGSPVMSDLKDSSDLEAHANCVLMLTSDRPVNAVSNDRSVSWVWIVKQRGGPTGCCKMQWWPHTLTFLPWEEDQRHAPQGKTTSGQRREEEIRANQRRGPERGHGGGDYEGISDVDTSHQEELGL